MSTRKVANVQDAKSFATVAAQFCKSINIQLCLKKDIDEFSSALVLDKCFQKATAIAEISKVHCIVAAENGQVHCLLYSSQLSALHEIQQSNDAEETYSDSVNEITRSEVSDGSCNNSGDSEDEESSGDGGILHRNSASTFHWPRREDMDRVHFSNIFSDPVTVPQFIGGTFEILEMPAMEKLFKVIRKHKKV